MQEKTHWENSLGARRRVILVNPHLGSIYEVLSLCLEQALQRAWGVVSLCLAKFIQSQQARIKLCPATSL